MRGWLAMSRNLGTLLETAQREKCCGTLRQMRNQEAVAYFLFFSENDQMCKVLVAGVLNQFFHFIAAYKKDIQNRE